MAEMVNTHLVGLIFVVRKSHIKELLNFKYEK